MIYNPFERIQMFIKKLNTEKVDITVKNEDTTKLVSSFIASTSAVDRYGDIVEQSWDLESYKKNPIILFNHNPLELPIGRGSVEVVDNQLMIDIEFDINDPLAAEIGRKVKDGYLNAVSVGFNPIESILRSELPKDHKFYSEQGTYFQKSQLLEVSVVTIPANQEAVAAKDYIKRLQLEDSEIEAIKIIIEELKNASNMHLGQAKKLEEIILANNENEEAEESEDVEEEKYGKHEEEDSEEEKHLEEVEFIKIFANNNLGPLPKKEDQSNFNDLIKLIINAGT